ncbi:carboxylesterase family protein [Chryseolinea sp. H1M3-3]|uniref:carboxylesterase/lipase family protein n=1 Tax=Chryseolinea sp. H1M3-3 TaxID=3034144 RepID=UPI0023EC724E|nr:carboxylesterase family protein [Chryseolinea sp. H1M3-3]
MKHVTISLMLLLMLYTTALYSQRSSSLPIQTGSDVAVVQTGSGKVRGYVHNGIFTYKGIPYAQAKRFQPPQKPASWDGIRSSMTYGPVSPLMTPTTQVADETEFLFHHDWGYTNEDCLRLNIWTKGINDGKKRPVMFWIHGGGYTAGSSQELPSYDGESISRKGDVVLVSVNHRLNILGFLDLSEFGDKYKSSANASFLDLVMALQWVKDNIANFGGDPNNVTIFGQSGGGGKVSTLMSSPMAKGLFHKAIVQSGVWADFQEQAISKRIGSAVLNELGLIPSQVDSIQKVPYDKLVAAGNKALQKVKDQLAAEGKPVGFGLRFGWGPTIDGEFLKNNMSDPEALAISSNIPLLIGSTKNEFMPSLRNPELRKGNAEQVKVYLQKQWGDKADAYIAAVKKAYPNDTRPTDLMDIDAFFRPGMVAQANTKSSNSSAPVYMYLFTWQSPVMNGDYKAVHCMEIPFTMNNIARCEEMTGGGKEAYALADKMSHAWINFARSGDPNHKGLPNWPKYNAAVGATMMFDNVPAVRNHPDKELLEITSKVPPRF